MNETLFHLRWARLVLLVEKWMSLLIMALFMLMELPLAALVFIAIALLFFYLIAHNHYHQLEFSAGMPANQLVVHY